MPCQYKPGDTAFLIESGRFIREGRVLRSMGGLCSFHFADAMGGVRVSIDRLYPTKEEAEAKIRKPLCSQFRRPR